MTKIYARPLLDHQSIENFLDGCLGLTKEYKCQTTGTSFEKSYIVKKIRDAESAVGQTRLDPTFTSERNRDPKYRSEPARDALREKIIEELISLDRLDNDEDIRLGQGGAKPKNATPAQESKAYFVIGLPASGKSTLVTRTADQLGAVILDSDFAKRKLPEFDNTLAGAQLVHRESSSIIWGGNEQKPSLFGLCKENKLNVVVPTVGQDYDDLNTRCHTFLQAGYEVHLTTTSLPREIATQRALERFLTTGRYVPLGLIFDAYANDPLLNYYKNRIEALPPKATNWSSFGAISTASSPPLLVDCTSNENPAYLLRSAP